MIVSAVAEILKNVWTVREWRFADPVCALAAHLRVAQGRAVHPLRHVMAADAGISAHTLGHHSRTVVRTTRAEIRDALRHVRGFGGNALTLLEPRHARADFVIMTVFEEPLANADRDLVRIERALYRK